MGRLKCIFTVNNTDKGLVFFADSQTTVESIHEYAIKQLKHLYPEVKENDITGEITWTQK